jgi:hypothetical protein
MVPRCQIRGGAMPVILFVGAPLSLFRLCLLVVFSVDVCAF